jgi:arylsulfatase A
VNPTRRLAPLILLPTLLLSATDAAGAGAQPVEQARRAPRPPNIVFILIDDLGWADLGCYGSTFHETTRLDRLASRGMRFTNAYAAAPLCSPTRAAILCGKHPARLNLTTYLPGRPDSPAQKLLQAKIRQQLPLEEVTLPELLKEKGYRCAHFGKWHLGGKGFLPEDQGFDVNLGGTAGGSPPGPGGFFAFQTPTLQARNQREYLTDRHTDEAIDFIETNRDRPFFLYLPHFAVHIPLQGKKELLAKYEAKAKPGLGLDKGQNNPIYAAMLESVDESVGRVVDKLEELGLAHSTLVIFTSDNGGLSVREGPNTPATSNAPLRAAKGHLYEGGIRVPLIAWWPGTIDEGVVSSVQVNSLDFFPTLLELAGVEAPPGRVMDGVSLLPLLKGRGTIDRDAMYWHLPHYSNQGGKPSGAVIQDEMKLIEFYEDGRLELYFLLKDIGEKNDLSKQLPDVTKRMHAMLQRWRESVDAQMPVPNPDYDPDWTPPPPGKKPVVKRPAVPVPG